MSVQTSISIPVHRRRGTLVVLVAVLLAAGAAAALLAVMLTGGGDKTRPVVVRPVDPSRPHATLAPSSLMAMTPEQLAEVAPGGYVLPATLDNARMAKVMASMSPETRRYTTKIMSLTFAQLAAGAAGSP
ncbi:MAG TPA: hypothetical protein VH541_06395 [Gaiellaceae bacterium]|jgi:hypothetical protein